jgi:hypothetical protein
MTVADEAQRMLDRWNPATDAPNQWNQANKSWRTNRPKHLSFFSNLSSIAPVGAHLTLDEIEEA